MKEILGWAVGTVVLLAFLLALGIGADYASMHWGRYAMPFNEETRRQTYEQSAARQEGVETNITSYCLNMRTAKTNSDKKAFANFVMSESGRYQGEISADAQACVNEARALTTAPNGL